MKNLKGTVGVSSDMYAFSPCGVCVRVFLPDGSGTETYFINDECITCTWSVSPMHDVQD